MQNQSDKKTLAQELDEQLSSWQTRIDEARVQMNLGAKEAGEKMQPHVDMLEEQLRQAKQQWEKMSTSSEGAWGEIKTGLNESMQSMQQAFDKAKQHFPDKDK